MYTDHHSNRRAPYEISEGEDEHDHRLQRRGQIPRSGRYLRDDPQDHQASSAGAPSLGQVECKRREKNVDAVRDVMAKRIDKTHDRISAKRLLPEAMAAGYVGSARNFRRLMAEEKQV